MSIQVVSSNPTIAQPLSQVQESNTCKKAANIFYHAIQLGTIVGGIYLIATNWNAKGYDVSLIGLGSVLVAVPISVYLCVYLPKYLKKPDCLSIIE